MRRGSPTLSRKPHKIFCIIGHGWYKSSCIGIEILLQLGNEEEVSMRELLLLLLLLSNVP
jgi:hypothetical protein